MNDYWNDPPETPDPPACPGDHCDGSGEYLYAGKTGHVMSCDTCGYQWVIPYPEEQPEPPDQEPVEPEPDQEPCPHGKLGECDACDHLSDLAYDAERERRLK